MWGSVVGTQLWDEPFRMIQTLVREAKNMTMARIATHTPLNETLAGIAPPEFQPSPPPPKPSSSDPFPKPPVSFSGISLSWVGVKSELPMCLALPYPVNTYSLTPLLSRALGRDSNTKLSANRITSKHFADSNSLSRNSSESCCSDPE